MNWQSMLALIQSRVGAGQVTTYGNCSYWAFGHRGAGQSVRAMLEAAAIRGNQSWTNRVVANNGMLGRATHAHGQLTQLKSEGVPFSGPSRVDLVQCPPIP